MTPMILLSIAYRSAQYAAGAALDIAGAVTKRIAFPGKLRAEAERDLVMALADVRSEKRRAEAAEATCGEFDVSLRKLLAFQDADRNWAREAGLTAEAIRGVLGRLEDDEISVGRAVDLLRELAIAAVEEARRSLDELATVTGQAITIGTCLAPGEEPSAPPDHAIVHAVQKLRHERDEALARIDELEKQLSSRPEVRWTSNGEAGDGQETCQDCGRDVDGDHTWEECARNLKEQLNVPCAGCDHWREQIAELESQIAAQRAPRDLPLAEGSRWDGDAVFTPGSPIVPCRDTRLYIREDPVSNKTLLISARVGLETRFSNVRNVLALLARHGLLPVREDPEAAARERVLEWAAEPIQYQTRYIKPERTKDGIVLHAMGRDWGGCEDHYFKHGRTWTELARELGLTEESDGIR